MKCSNQRSFAHFRSRPCNTRPEPWAVSHFFAFIGNAPDAIANKQKRWREVKKATMSAVVSGAERAMTGRYAVMRYHRKRDFIVPRRRYQRACARDGSTPLPLDEWKKKCLLTDGGASL